MTPIRRSAILRAAAIAALCAAVLAGCTLPRFHQREALVLDDATVARFDVTYGEPHDCVMRQRWATRYRLDRGDYRIVLTPVLRFADEPAELRLDLDGSGEMRAEITGAQVVEQTALSDTRRYKLHPAQRAGSMTITIWRDARRLGAETIEFHTEQCRALMWRRGAPAAEAE